MRSTECQELKNINYKSMLLNHKNKSIVPESSTHSPDSEVDDFLEQERSMVKVLPWNKLDKSNKIKKIQDYTNIFCDENGFGDVDHSIIFNHLISCLNKKRLQRTKDVVYDKEHGKILNIPGFSYDSEKRKIVMIRDERKSSVSTNISRNSKQKTKKTKKTVKASKSKNL